MIKFLALLLTVLYASAAFAQKPAEFAGKWAFERTKSNAGKGSSFATESTHILTIKQDPNTISITMVTIVNGAVRDTTVDEYTLDGKETVTPSGGQELKTMAKWSNDKKRLTITTSMTYQGNEHRNDDVYFLSANGTVLTIESAYKSANGVSKMIKVYSKQ